jgi:hypothetical protein
MLFNHTKFNDGCEEDLNKIKDIDQLISDTQPLSSEYPAHKNAALIGHPCQKCSLAPDA